MAPAQNWWRCNVQLVNVTVEWSTRVRSVNTQLVNDVCGESLTMQFSDRMPSAATTPSQKNTRNSPLGWAAAISPPNQRTVWPTGSDRMFTDGSAGVFKNRAPGSQITVSPKSIVIGK